jgi:hypothetical protein
MHNTQPWRFRIQDAGSTIELHLDPARMLPAGDPDGRAAHIACGAALLNVRVAVADAGLRPDIRLLPNPDQSLLLAEAACLEGATLAFLDRDEAERVLRLAAEAGRDLLADPAYRAELARWTGGHRDRDGIPGSALGPRSPEGRDPVRDFTPGRRPAPMRYAWFEEHPQLAVLSAGPDGPVAWLAAGQACSGSG